MRQLSAQEIMFKKKKKNVQTKNVKQNSIRTMFIHVSNAARIFA